jgi:ParB family transcriptional regulator, chromosome partitioning protein
MTEFTEIAFSKLIASDVINARPATKDKLEELVASIRASGIIQPLVVRPAIADGQFEIIDGRRRFAALAQLVKAKEIKRSHMVPVVIRYETDGEALETSLAANIMRLGMHPVDEFIAFARLADQGRTDEEIAASFAIDTRRVRQRRALGTLAPVIRDAYRKGKLDEKQVQAFTAHADHGVQEAAFEKLRRQGGGALQPYSIRRELMPDAVPAASCMALQLVGEQAYLDAGGTLTDGTLFDDTRYVDDVPLAKRLARDLLRAECGRLHAEGWAWVIPALEDGDPGAWNYDHVHGEHFPSDDSLEYTAEEKAASGCIVDGRDGSIEIVRGLVRRDGQAFEAEAEEPDDAPVLGAEIDDGEEPAARSTPDDDPFAISGALTETITGAQSLAIAQLVRDDFELALRLALAALASYSAPVQITDTSGRRMAELRQFADIWREAAGNTYGSAMKDFAAAVAGTVSVVALNPWADRSDANALVASLPVEKYTRWMREAFDPADYFKRASKETALAAIEEIVEAGAGGGLAPIDVLADMKKADLAAAAAGAAKACGWLPPQLRHSTPVRFEIARDEAAE